MTQTLPQSPVDFLIFAPLEEERDALLSKLPGHRRLDSDGTDVHVYFEAEIATRRQDKAVYRVIVTSPIDMGPIHAAITASAVTERWRPEHVLVVGIAGGLKGEVSLGDVVVARFVADYTVGKVEDDGSREERWQQYPADAALLNFANAFRTRWEDLIAEPLPEGDGKPVRHAGVIASGGDVISSGNLIAAYRKDMPKLIGVEMEGSGVAAALNSHKFRPRFLMIRGVSDLADGEGNAAMKKRWRAYARDVAAAYAIGLLREGPGPASVRGARQEPSLLLPSPTSPATGTAFFTAHQAPPAPPAQPVPSYPDAASRLLAERLDGARVRQRALRDAGLPAADVDREILDLRRQLREGGQLRAGDSIADGRYLLVKQAGRGGFATVWEAYDRERSQLVAIKVLHSNLAGDAHRRERFYRGARAMASLTHNAVVRVLEPPGEDGGFCYFVMEFVAGGDLRSVVLDQRLPKETVVPFIIRVGEALAEAHAKGMVHRDVKPANILLDKEGQPKLTDFDLVGAADTTGGTRTGALGTVVYAAPECLDHPQSATARADVYALGMTMIFALYGAEIPGTMLFQGRMGQIVDRLSCDKEIKLILARAIAVRPEERFEDARGLCEALRATLIARAIPQLAPAVELASLSAPLRAAFLRTSTPSGSTIPILPLRQQVLFPMSVVPVNVGRPRSLRLVEDLLNRELTQIGVLSQLSPDTEEPTLQELYTIGTVMRVIKIIRLGPKNYSIVLSGLARFRIKDITLTEPYMRGMVDRIPEPLTQDVELDALSAGLRESTLEMLQFKPNLARDTARILDNVHDPGALADLIAANFSQAQMSVADKQKILETVDITTRVRLVLSMVATSIEVHRSANTTKSKE